MWLTDITMYSVSCMSIKYITNHNNLKCYQVFIRINLDVDRYSKECNSTIKQII